MTPRDARDGGLFNLFLSDWETAPAWLPAGVSAWAIGDVHGYLRHLEALLVGVEALIRQAPPGPRHLVTLGDYLDRGPDGIGVLERVAALDIPGVSVTRLIGNHEEFLDRFLNDPNLEDDFVDFWAMNGGLATLANLGVGPADVRRLGPAGVIARVRATAPDSVRRALELLKLGLRVGGYLFVHAGVHPGHALDDSEFQQPTTIREPFLSGEGWVHDFAVVHGHTIVGPDIRPHRISVDSGTYYTGVLTCAELRGDQVRFLCATRAENLDALVRVRGRRPLRGETWRRLEPVTLEPGRPVNSSV